MYWLLHCIRSNSQPHYRWLRAVGYPLARLKKIISPRYENEDNRGNYVIPDNTRLCRTIPYQTIPYGQTYFATPLIEAGEGTPVNSPEYSTHDECCIVLMKLWVLWRTTPVYAYTHTRPPDTRTGLCAINMTQTWVDGADFVIEMFALLDNALHGRGVLAFKLHNTDLLRLCMYVCMYVCIYVCIHLNTNLDRVFEVLH